MHPGAKQLNTSAIHNAAPSAVCPGINHFMQQNYGKYRGITSMCAAQAHQHCSTSVAGDRLLGSSTELAPSLLGIYDTLTNSFAAGGVAAAPTATSHESKASSSGDSTPKRSNSNCSSSSTGSSTGSCSSVPTSDDQSASYTLASSSTHLGHQEPPAPLVVAGLRDEPDGAQLSRLVQRRSQESQIHGSSSSIASSGSSRRGSNIRILSPNVHRIITHSEIQPVEACSLNVTLVSEEPNRTPDRSTWKWSLHSGSNSTPTYLERRNACRRSEIRQRNSKFKRKTVANSSSFDSFNESLEQEEESVSQAKPSKPLARNNSLDDTALQKLAAAMRYRKRDAAVKEETKTPVKEPCKCDQDAKQDERIEPCSCILRDQRSRSAKSHSPVFSYKALKERSKSVPRIGGFNLDEEAEREREQDEDSAASLRGSKPDFTERKTKGKGFFEVKQYNHKTMPKKIANLKKQRSSTTKRWSRFYPDLSEFDSSSSTVLKITESTEELRPDGEIELAQEAATLDESTQDQYYSPEHETELLSPAEKSKRDAQIVLDLLKNNKEFERIYNKQQKRRESPVSPVSPDISRGPILPPPRPPSRSPPPLELEEQETKPVEEVDSVSEEPIYETLLRNVHVPYKFSPVLGRAKSSQMLKKRSKTAPAASRPESDYVTLVYSPEGVLQRVGEEVVQRDSCSSSTTSTSSNGSGSTLKRDSQSTVINLLMEAVQEHGSRPLPKNSVSGSESSLLPRALKSIDNLSMAFGRSNRPPERRVSDVTEMCRQSVLHRQGSEAVGERMAHVDYADPKALFGRGVLNHSERDSVLSLTSSSTDSMCEQQRKRSGVDSPGATFEYEQQVEDSLENDFRDSAIYSDDNEKRSGDYDVHLRRPSSPPPPPPPLGPRPHQPPQIAPKPPKDQLIQQRSGVIVCQSASRSWVLQQIENFNK
ncbi:GD25385 [Drosophila simulans]|uniref:GD25385 n=1 Tax=Drosophila simulans TaxID=7240 RepID=B4QCZ2_DROSI|nr:GD25385 [Drosophila simulans]